MNIEKPSEEPHERQADVTPTAEDTASPNSDVANGLLLPDGTLVEFSKRQDRKSSRKSEDASYVPVIIKRTDETRRHPDDALEDAIHEGLEQLARPSVSLWLSSVAGGLIVGFSPMAVAVVQTAMIEYQLPALVQRLGIAVVYPLGFIMCILSGAQLFTEHTATAFYPVLDRKARIGALIRLWAIVVAGNLIGAACSATLLFAADGVIQAGEGFRIIGHHLVEPTSTGLLVSAILAGWLMAMGAWLAVASPRTIAQIALIFTATFLIGVGGLHHSIAGSCEMFAAMWFDSHFTPVMAIRFIGLALLGNMIGGSCFVALLNYAHIRRTNE